MTEAQKRAQANYRKKCKKVSFEFWPTEQDLLDHYEKQPQKRTYLKDLIRADMTREGTTIEPCPICQSLPHIVCDRVSDIILFGAKCCNTDCTARAGTLFFPTVHGAVRAWNERIGGENNER